MNKKLTFALLVVIALLVVGAGYLFFSLTQQKQANKKMQELAELDKKEMENEYEQFARQYSEMKTQINNDSIVAQLTQEQMKTQQLLEELKRVKSSDAREIARLKKELKGLEGDVAKFSKKLSNPGFLAKAAPEIIEKDRAKLADLSDKLERVKEQLAEIG